MTKHEINLLRKKHAWLLIPIQNATRHVSGMYFYEWLARLKTPKEFKAVAAQMYYHSVSFPKAISLMSALTPIKQSAVLPLYAKHNFEEADHHLLLLNWMIKHRLLKSKMEVHSIPPTLEANACINIGYRLGLDGDAEKWIATFNLAIEACSKELFKALAPKMREIGAGDIYFDVHVEADEDHSIMGIEFIKAYQPDSARGKELLGSSMEAISLWARMIHSWLGYSAVTSFDLQGRAVKERILRKLNSTKLTKKENAIQ